MSYNLLFSFFFLLLFGGCGMVEEIERATCEINRNTEAVEKSTRAINRNIIELENIKSAG